MPEPHSNHNLNLDRNVQKRTRQLQEAIAAIIKDLPRGVHLTAPEVYRRAREQGLQVSLSTVYRTLGLMQADGNVSTLAGDHGRRYEARDSEHDHDHLICLKCGLTIEFTDDLIKGFGRLVAERKGYDHKSSRFDILGICADCKAKDEDHKIATSISGLESAREIAEQTAQQLSAVIAVLESRKTARAQEALGGLLTRMQDAVAELEAASEILTGNTELQ